MLCLINFSRHVTKKRVAMSNFTATIRMTKDLSFTKNKLYLVIGHRKYFFPLMCKLKVGLCASIFTGENR